MELAFDAMIGKTNEEIALRMKTIYHDGSGFELDGRRFSVWFDPSGIQMAAGDRARYANNAQVISWTDAAKHVGALIEAGQFGTQLENVEAPGTIRRKVAERLIYMYRDSAARENGYLSLMTDTPLIFPDCVNHLSEKMEQPEFLHGLIRQMEVFADAVAMQPDLMRFRFLLPKDILPRLRDLALARKELPEGEMLLPDVRGFMTQDEIDAVLTQNAPIAGAGSRIYQFFSAPHSTNEKLEFLKNEYGIGGKMPGVSGERGSSESHDAKGIQLRKSNCPDVLLKWNQVAERIDGLIQMNRYLTPEKQALYEKKEVQDSARNTDYDTYNSIKAAHPDEIVLFQVGDFFELYDEDARQAAENLGLNLTSRNLEGVGRVAMCKIPAHSLEQYVEQLRDKVDVTIAEKRENSAAYHVYTLLSVDHEAENAINAYEAEFGADGTRVFRDSAIEQQTQPTMQAMHGNLQSKQGQNEQEQNPNYRLLSRLKADCDYFLDAGGRAEKYLWAGNVRAQIAKMREIYETLPAKPEWLTKEAIDDYDEQMTPQYQVVVYHHFENGFDEKIEYQTLEEAIKVAQGYVNGTMESDGFAYDGAAVYNHQEHRYLYIYGHYPDEKAHAQVEALGNMGFQSGNILEPSCGVGNFFGMLPESMSQSRLYGVELDSITGRIARQLYPDAQIEIRGFEKTSRKDFFDVAVGNVPFGNYKVADKPFDKYGFLIHDYFFAKALEQVRPGGVIAFITSKGTMDKASPDVRRYIAQRAELLGAIRLPNNAFKANAGTEVTSDILFLQKREHPIDIEPDWIHLGQTADGIPINSYFVDHPDMMLGRMQWDKSMYGNEKETTCEPIPGADLAQQLHAAVRNIDGKYKRIELSEMDINEGRTIPADPDVRNFSYALVNGQVYYRENSVMTRPVLNQTTQERVKGMIELRDCVRKLIDLQLTDGSDAEIRAQQEELGRLYDAFSAEYGIINGKANGRAFEGDSSYYLLCSLEILDEDRKLKRKADIFSKRTIRRRKPVTQVDTASEALAVSIGERAKVDLPFMARLTGKAEDEIVADLQGVIFLDPLEQTWQTADEYLSGNVRAKLRVAQTTAESDSSFAVNVEALQAAQPKDLDASEIDVRLGTTWVDKAYIQRFMIELLGIPYYEQRRIHVNYAPQTAEWSIDGKSLLSENVNNYMKYGTRRAPALKILEDTLNLRDTRVYDVVQDENGREKRELNQKETTIAQQKQQAIKDAFHDWVWKDPTRRHELVTRYNELFNSTRPREYDGSHIVFDGMNPEITLREHQRTAIAHVLYGGNTLLAHQVGAGKTFEMVAAAMESKRLGLCQKSMFVVPNHLTEQWASEFLRLYPSANILVTTKKDFEKAKRKQFCARIATGDYDAVIIGHSQFEKIPISQERQERLLREQIDEIAAGIEEMERENGERFTIKRMEATRKSLEARLEKLKADEKKDDVVTFEELGVDRLFVDEAHAFKNGFLATKMRNVAGIATSESQKSTDMFLKCRYMDELTGGRGVIFATGTPVSNSMTELYTMQRYLQYGTLEKMGLIHFDAWASTFGETVTAIELAPEGTGYRARTRFAKFFNLPELMAMFKEVADIKTADQLHLPVPNAHYETMAVKPSVYQEEMVEALSERASKVHSGAVDPKEDNMLRITSDGRKLGLDQRLMNPLLPDEPGSKVNACMENILRIYKEGDAQKLTQLVFCDLSTPHGDGSFNVYDDIRDKLVASGIPKEEIQFIHDADTEIKKKDLFAKVRSGQVRILFGSTQKLGAGTNVQDRLIALHDLDAPWRPGDLEQRAGRIVRQGNMNPDVHIYRYVTEKSFDSYLWQTIENKQRFISQIMSSKSPVRACDDVDETALSYAEIKALCAGDPRIREKMDLDIEVAKLRLMKADYQSNQFKLEDQILKQYPEEIRQAQERAKGYRADMALLEAHPLPKDGFVGMAIKGKRIADKEAAGKMLLEACRLSPHDMELGEYRGMKMTVDYDSYRQEVKLVLRGEMSHTVIMGTDVYGNLTRIENALANMPQKLEKAEERIAELERQTEQARAELGKPFAQEKELEAKAARLAELNAALNIDEKRKEPMEKRPMKDVLKAYQERADAQSQGEKGGTNEWNR